MTPEGKIKFHVKQALQASTCTWYFMPVQSGYGKTVLDFIGCHDGQFFAIETKAPGKKPTRMQDNCIKDLKSVNARVFVIDGTNNTDTIDELKEYLSKLR